VEDFYNDIDELNKLISGDKNSEPVAEKGFKGLSILERVDTLLASANEGLHPSRQTLPGEAHQVTLRSLRKNALVLDSELRAFKVMRDVEAFVTANRTGQLREASVEYSDLLYYGNPAFTVNDLDPWGPDDIEEARVEWISSDPRVAVEHRPLVASAFASPSDSVEREFAVARMQALGAEEIPVDLVLSAIEYES
jgi:hypothetical protein